MAEKKIAGMTIKVDRPLATQALKLQARLVRAAGALVDKFPALVASRKQSLSPEETAKIEAEALAAIVDIFNRLSPDEYADLVGEIVGIAQIQRPSGAYDHMDLDGDFSLNLGAIIPVALFVLQETFGDFFAAATASGTRSMKAKG